VGDDHLDADAAMLRVKREKKSKEKATPVSQEEERERRRRAKELAKRRDQVTTQVEKAEERVGAINEIFCDPTYFEKTPPKEVAKLEREQKELNATIEELMGEWEKIETELEQLGAS